MTSLKEFVQRNQFRLFQERMRESLDLSYNTCSHMSGTLGSESAMSTAIVWHELDTGVVYGICFACGRHFKPGQPDYIYWRDKKSLNVRSQASLGRSVPITQEEYAQGAKDQFCPLDKHYPLYPLLINQDKEYVW